MVNLVNIKFTVTGVNCDILAHRGKITSLDVLNEAIIGDVDMAFGDNHFAINGCGLLGFGTSLRWLCTYPILYGLTAVDIAHDDPMKFTARYVAPSLLLTISELGSGEGAELQVDPVQLLQSLGAEYRKALMILFERCPEIKQHPELLAGIPDSINLLSAL